MPIVGDCRLVIERDHQGDPRPAATSGTEQADTGAWKSRISGWREQFPLTYEQSEPGEALKPQFCLEQLRDNAPEGTILVSGVGQHQMWSSQYWRFNEPYTWVNSGGLGTMGFSVPAAIGAKVGRPDRTVWAIDGDGCFQMTAQELVTASVERIPIKVAILNNSYLGMVRQWQEMFYDERYSEVYLSPELPDFVKWAEAMGCVGIRVDIARGGAAGDRQGQLHRRPPRRRRLPRRRPRRRCSRWCRPAWATTTSSCRPSKRPGRERCDERAAAQKPKETTTYLERTSPTVAVAVGEQRVRGEARKKAPR